MDCVAGTQRPMNSRQRDNDLRETPRRCRLDRALKTRCAVLLGCAMISTATLSSCQTMPRPGAGGSDLQVPSYEPIATRHNDRLDRMTSVNAAGAIELRWTDDQGRHFESGRAEVWIVLPDRTAIDVQKFGERLMWMGSNGSNTWMIDFRGDETVLPLSDASGENPPEAAARVPIEPVTLLKLLGLGRLPAEAETDSSPVTYDAGREAWVVTVREADHRLRLFFDRESFLPIRVELLAPDHEILRHSTLSLRRYDSVQMAGAVPGTQPRFPTLAEVFDADGSGSIKLALRGPTDAVKDKYFELDWLRRAFRPDRIEGQLEMSSTP